MNSRVALVLIVFLAGISIFIGCLLLDNNLSIPASLPFFKAGKAENSAKPESTVAASTKSLNIAITETNGWHDEVVAALVHAFGSHSAAHVSLYQARSRFGMSDIIGTFPAVPTTYSVDQFKNNTTTPDIVVLTTGELDSANLQPRLSELLAGGRTYLFCVVHHGDQWSDVKRKEILAPWMDQGLMDFITLSPHTANFLKANGLKDWTKKDSSIKSLTPLFPIPPPSPSRQGIIDKQRELAFAIQGNYEPSRRDFNTIFSHLQTFVNTSNFRNDEDKGANITLHLLGSGNRPSVPKGLTNHVFFDEGLSYSEFYAVLSNTFAILPAFADKDYLDRKASSTVPASLLGGTPLIATKEILSAYSYLPEDAVYLQQKEETELHAVGRILQLTAWERKEKKARVKNACTEIIKSNALLVESWIQEAKLRLGY